MIQLALVNVVYFTICTAILTKKISKCYYSYLSNSHILAVSLVNITTDLWKKMAKNVKRFLVKYTISVCIQNKGREIYPFFQQSRWSSGLRRRTRSTCSKQAEVRIPVMSDHFFSFTISNLLHIFSQFSLQIFSIPYKSLVKLTKYSARMRSLDKSLQ